MSMNFIGEIRMLGFRFPPARWAFCHGQYLTIAQYNAVYALLGTTFGGNGTNNFRLPDLQGRMPVGVGASQTGGLPNVGFGQMGGTYMTTLGLQNLPSHTHAAVFTPDQGGGGGTPAQVEVSTDVGKVNAPDAANPYLAGSPAGPPGAKMWTDNLTNKMNLGGVTGGGGSGGGGGTVTVGNTGLGESVQTVSPFTALNFSIALAGLFPQRN